MSNNFQIIKGFLEFLQVRHYSPATISSRRESLKLFFRYLEKVGLTDLREVTRRTICDYQAWLMERFATNSVHVHLIALRRFFEHLEVIDAIFLNPCAGLCLPKLEDRLPRGILTPTETRALLDAPDTRTPLGVRDKAILELRPKLRRFSARRTAPSTLVRLTTVKSSSSPCPRSSRPSGAT
jgi:integrase/recombinase XerD